MLHQRIRADTRRMNRETELVAAQYVTPITRGGAVERVSVPAAMARRGNGVGTVIPRCGSHVDPINMGTTPGPLRSLAGNTRYTTPGKAQGCIQLPNRQQGAQSSERRAKALTHGGQDSPPHPLENRAVLVSLMQPWPTAIPKPLAWTIHRKMACQAQTSRMN